MNSFNEQVVLELQSLSKSYGSHEAVRNISLAVAKGEVFGFLGPNGAGKTTTIKCCAGLLRPTTGSIRIGGFDLTGQPAAAKALLGYVPDNPFLYDKLTGREFSTFMARLYGVEEAGLAEIVISRELLYCYHRQV